MYICALGRIYPTSQQEPLDEKPEVVFYLFLRSFSMLDFLEGVISHGRKS
jgi:hypothetical protein